MGKALYIYIYLYIRVVQKSMRKIKVKNIQLHIAALVPLCKLNYQTKIWINWRIFRGRYELQVVSFYFSFVKVHRLQVILKQINQLLQFNLRRLLKSLRKVFTRGSTSQCFQNSGKGSYMLPEGSCHEVETSVISYYENAAFHGQRIVRLQIPRSLEFR